MTRLAFDMAAFLWRSLLAGKDKENGVEVLHEEKKHWVNSAQYGYDLAMGMMLDAMNYAGVTPHRCILVFEGMHSKRRRLAIDPGYKANRDSRPPQAYEEYQKAIAMMEKAWKDVGACSMRQSFVEGDDVLGYLAHHAEDRLVIATFDNDMLALSGVNPQGHQVDVWVDGRVNVNKYGDFAFKHVTLYKALVGDSSDGIKGCAGFGPKAWDVFRLTYGDEGLDYLHNLLEVGSLGELHAQRDEDKLVRMICDQEKQVMNSYQLAKIHHEWVNTVKTALEISAGMCMPRTDETDGRLAKWAGESWLVTRGNFAERSAFCLAQFKRSPFVALDIETSTPPESDEWLANQQPPNPDGVDVLGSFLVGLSLTFGDNLQYTVYISVEHAETNNVTSEEVRQLVAQIRCAIVIQNLAFELPVLYQEWGEKQEDNGYHGFLPYCLDTKLEASYEDENSERGLKQRSLARLGYTQQSFHETTQFTGPADELRPGGRVVKVLSNRKYFDAAGEEISEEKALELDAAGADASFNEAVVTKQYKMDELPATHVFGYGCDDTICTAALHNHYRLVMELEHHWQAYLDVEIDAAYMSAVGYLQGTNFSPAKMRELVAEDDKTYDAAWATVRSYLLSKGWPGSLCPEFNVSSKAADLKLAYQIVTGKELPSKARNPDNLAKVMEAEGEETLAALLMGCYNKPAYDDSGVMTPPWKLFNDYVKKHFRGEPEFNIGSPKQKQTLLYEVMGLPIRIRNKPTDQMRAAGIREGGAKTDALAIDWALKFDAKEEDKPTLQALKLMQMVETRRDLFYSKWPGYVHWKTGKVHSTVNQCQANTRRSSEGSPNKQQLGKRQGPDGKTPRFRECIIPHHQDAVIVSLDEKSQELRIITDYSRDPNMLACFVGDDQKDMHHLTGLSIAQYKYRDVAWSYEVFRDALLDKKSELYPRAVECRTLGKTTNFSAEFGIMAKKLGERMLVSEEEAQVFLDAREAAFPVAAEWKQKVIHECKNTGIARTMMGAVRHLRDALNSSDGYTASKAERQGPNFKVQGSGAEQTKRASGGAWKADLIFKHDCEYIGNIHDEVVWSVGIPDLLPFLQDMHALMVQPYGGMTIPIESSISFGPSFGEQVEIGEVVTAEAVEKGLKEVEKLREKSRAAATPA